MSAHDHDHDHDCDHDHDNDGDYSVEQGITGLVLAFAEITFAQIDYDAFSASPPQRRLGLLFLLGAVQSLCDLEELDDSQVEVVFGSVLSELFSWSDEEVASSVKMAMQAAEVDSEGEALARGREALETTLASTYSLADLLDTCGA